MICLFDKLEVSDFFFRYSLSLGFPHDRNNTYIQSEGINQDFGVYDSPDDLLKAHHQEMSAIKAFLYKHFGRHLMNRNVKKIRNC